jgi:hypothetical protein
MKDFFDLALLAERFEFDGAELVTSLRATFERRGTPLPDEPPVALTSSFSTDPAKRVQWKAFATKATSTRAPEELEAVIARVRAFALEPLTAAVRSAAWVRRWPAGGPWVEGV